MSTRSRIKELDLTKTFILLVAMIGTHTFYDLTTMEITQSAIGSVLNVLAGTFGAPVFMFCMGITLHFSRYQSPKDWLRRGISLLTIGMAVNILRWGTYAFDAYWTHQPELYKGVALIYNVDIMQFAGLAFLLMALCNYLRLNHRAILAIGVALNLAGSLLEGHYTDSYALNQLLGYFYPTPTCCCFPLFNWFIFVAAGNTMGTHYSQTNDIGHFFRWMLLIGGLVTAVYLYLTIVVQVPVLRTLQGDWGLYWMNPYDALPTAFFIAPFMVGVFWLLGKLIPDSWMRVLSYPSQHINQVFCISWIWIMWTAHVFLFVPKATTDGTFVVAWLSIIALTLLSIFIYEKYLQARLSPWFSRHATAWTIGIWVVSIAFGAWYFATVPGPYIMPY